MNIEIIKEEWNKYVAVLTFGNAGMAGKRFIAKTAYEALNAANAHVQMLEEGAGIKWG